MLRILGIDHSLSCTGLGVIDVTPDTKEVTYIYHGYNKVISNLFPYPISLKKQVDWIRSEVPKYNPTVVMLEGPHDVRGYIATQRLIELLGSIKTELLDLSIPFLEIPPSTMKKIVTGNGFSSKTEVASSISTLLGIPFEDLVDYTYYKQGIKKGQVKDLILDGTDALGLAIAGVTYIPRIGKLDYDGSKVL